jgi:hypothetical protein
MLPCFTELKVIQKLKSSESCVCPFFVYFIGLYFAIKIHFVGSICISLFWMLWPPSNQLSVAKSLYDYYLSAVT